MGRIALSGVGAFVATGVIVALMSAWVAAVALLFRLLPSGMPEVIGLGVLLCLSVFTVMFVNIYFSDIWKGERHGN